MAEQYPHIEIKRTLVFYLRRPWDIDINRKITLNRNEHAQPSIINENVSLLNGLFDGNGFMTQQYIKKFTELHPCDQLKNMPIVRKPIALRIVV